MIFLSAVVSVIAPLVPVLLPGIFIAFFKKDTPFVIRTAISFVWSLALATLVSFLVTVIGAHILYVFALLGITSLFLSIYYRSRWSLPLLWQLLAACILLLVVYLAFTIPYVYIHSGLPTGDVQKSILWAKDVLDNQRLPAYQESFVLLNRDPVDFYTPGLHTLLAYVLALSPLPFISAGFFSIILAITVAFLAAALTREILPRMRYAPLLAFFFVITNFRFLRYLREPGYHFQNIVGEIFLFAIILLAIRLIRKWSWPEAFLIILSVLSLALSHQFSAFLAVFALIPIAIGFFAAHHHFLRSIVFKRPSLSLAAVAMLVWLVAQGFELGLHRKIPHLFTTTPHLLDLVPPLMDYPFLLGTTFLAAALAGLILLFIHTYKKSPSTEKNAQLAFIGVAVVLLALSQGPRFFVDIPPVRALLYVIVPFSVAAAYFVSQLLFYITKQVRFPYKSVSYAVIALFIIIPQFNSVSRAFTTTNHSIRTNSTFTVGQTILNEYISLITEKGQAVLIDDYNRRSASWLVLSGRPMFTRIAAELGRQMEEARQSEQRYQLYLNQLDYEKIFSLGSQPYLTQLMDKHNIRLVTGIEKNSALGFSHNPALTAVAAQDDITLFMSQGTSVPCLEDSLCSWLLRAATLVNDIGDPEDTFEHLPASIRAPRLSDPAVKDGVTFRETTATLIPLSFNIGDYVRVLWDQEKTGFPDTAVELFVQFVDRPSQLSILTPAGKEYDIPSDSAMIKIPARELVFNEKGFVVLTLHNPEAAPVAIDIIALGLARTP